MRKSRVLAASSRLWRRRYRTAEVSLPGAISQLCFVSAYECQSVDIFGVSSPQRAGYFVVASPDAPVRCPYTSHVSCCRSRIFLAGLDELVVPYHCYRPFYSFLLGGTWPTIGFFYTPRGWHQHFFEGRSRRLNPTHCRRSHFKLLSAGR